MPDERQDDDTDSFWPWRHDESPAPVEGASEPPRAIDPGWGYPPPPPEPPVPEPPAPAVVEERLPDPAPAQPPPEPPAPPPVSEPTPSLARPPLRPPTALPARSVTPRGKLARQRPSLGQPHWRQLALDAALLLLAVVVVGLAYLALME